MMQHSLLTGSTAPMICQTMEKSCDKVSDVTRKYINTNTQGGEPVFLDFICFSNKTV